MLAQPVTPLTPSRLLTALGVLAPEVHSSPQGNHLIEIDGELVRIEHRPDRPFALTASTRWRRRLPVDHSSAVREFADESNRDLPPTRTSISVTDSGHLEVQVSLTHLVIGGVSDNQLAGWIGRGTNALLTQLGRLDRRFPEPAPLEDT
nr:hypothetical protein [Actinomycetales bacterium]